MSDALQCHSGTIDQWLQRTSNVAAQEIIDTETLRRVLVMGRLVVDEEAYLVDWRFFCQRGQIDVLHDNSF